MKVLSDSLLPRGTSCSRLNTTQQHHRKETPPNSTSVELLSLSDVPRCCFPPPHPPFSRPAAPFPRRRVTSARLSAPPRAEAAEVWRAEREDVAS